MPDSSDDRPGAEPTISVVIPCLNESATIAKVVDDFRAALPHADIVIIDNASDDDTADVARAHGARVITEPRRGKGFAVSRIFDDVDADYYVMVDGDDTYPADRVAELLAPVMQGRADMVVGARMADDPDAAYRRFHQLGNNLVRFLVNRIFNTQLGDIMSGYRAFNRRVIARLPLGSTGFETETEMTVQLLQHRLVVEECPIAYRERPEGSFSKLRTFHDGARVLATIFHMMRRLRPMAFFGGLSLVFLALGLLAGAAPIVDYVRFQYVYHVPLAILATGLVLLSAGGFVVGLILQTMQEHFRGLHSVLSRRAHREQKPASPPAASRAAEQ